MLRNLILSSILFSSILCGSYFIKIGKSSSSNTVLNLEIKTTQHGNYPAERVQEGFAELGWKSGNFDSPNRFRAFYMAYSGYDKYGLGGSYTISGYGCGIESKISKNNSHYFSLDWLLNREFYDYDDFSVGEWGILDKIYTYPETYFGFAVGIGTYLNKNVTIELNYKNHNQVHFSEFTYNTTFWWSFNYKRSGFSASISLDLF